MPSTGANQWPETKPTMSVMVSVVVQRASGLLVVTDGDGRHCRIHLAPPLARRRLSPEHVRSSRWRQGLGSEELLRERRAQPRRYRSGDQPRSTTRSRYTSGDIEHVNAILGLASSESLLEGLRRASVRTICRCPRPRWSRISARSSAAAGSDSAGADEHPMQDVGALVDRGRDAGEPGEEHDRVWFVEQRRDLGHAGDRDRLASSPAIDLSSSAFRIPSFEAKSR